MREWLRELDGEWLKELDGEWLKELGEGVA